MPCPQGGNAEGTGTRNINSPELLLMLITRGKRELKISISSACRAVCLPGPGGGDDTCLPHHVSIRWSVPREYGIILSLLSGLYT